MKNKHWLLPISAFALSLLAVSCSSPKITSYYVNVGGDLIAVYDDGTEENLGEWGEEFIKSYRDITVGEDGYYVIDGAKTSIKAQLPESYSVDEKGHLIVTYTDKTTEDLGPLGDSLVNGVTSIEVSQDGHYIINGVKTDIVAVSVYTVSFDTGFFETLPAQNVKDGYKVEKPSIERTGYTLDGWFCNDEEWRFNSDLVKNDMTLTAKWTANTYTITFENEMGLTPDSMTVAYDSAVILPAVDSVPGYTMGGWYYGDRVISNGIWKIASDVTLTAKWTRDQYKVIFDENGGAAVQDIVANSYSIVSNLPTPTWEDHTFLGWFDSDGNKVESACIEESDVYLTAHWKGISDSFEFRDEENGTITITKYTGNDQEVTIPATITGKTVKMIAEGAFASGGSVTKLTLNYKTNQLEYKSLTGLTSLEELTISGNVSGSLYYFFGNNVSNVPSSLKTLHFAEGSTTYGKAIFDNLPETYLFKVTLPVSVTKIPEDCFADCVNLLECTVPYGVTSFGTRSFCACSNLVSVNIPDSCTSLGTNCFVNDYALTYLVVPASVKSFNYGCLAATKSVIFLERTEKIENSSVFSIYEDKMHIYYGFETIKSNDTYTYALCKVESVKKCVILSLTDGATKPSSAPETIDGYPVDLSLI